MEDDRISILEIAKFCRKHRISFEEFYIAFTMGIFEGKSKEEKIKENIEKAAEKTKFNSSLKTWCTSKMRRACAA